MTTTTTKTIEAAREFARACRQRSWSWDVRDNVVTITKHFEPNSRDEYVECDGEYYGLLALVKARGGSMWGTDGSGVGGYSAMLHGRFVMNVSGVSARMTAALRAIADEIC